MKLLLRRSQRSAGMMGGKVVFALDARIDTTPEEDALIRKYKLGPTVVYSSQDARKHAGAALDNLNKGGLLGNAKALVSAGMSALSLVCTIDTLQRGQNIECKDLPELLDAEASIVAACNTTKSYLQTALTFDGREEVLEI